MWIEARDEIWNEINNSNSCFVAKSSKSSETGGLECKLKCHYHLFAIAAFSMNAVSMNYLAIDACSECIPMNPLSHNAFPMNYLSMHAFPMNAFSMN